MLPFVALAENQSDRRGSVMEDCQGLLCSRPEETMRCCIETGFCLCYVFKMLLCDLKQVPPAGWASDL